MTEPVRNARHVSFEISGNRQIQKSRTFRATIFEIVWNVRGYKHEGARSCLDPLCVNQKVECPAEHEEDVVLRMMVSSGALGVRFKPPFRDRIATFRFSTIGFEYC